MAAKPAKSKEVEEREAIEAELMGAQIVDDSPADTPDIESQENGEPQDIVDSEPEPQAAQEDIDSIRAQLAKLQDERNGLERAMREEREAKKQSEKTMAALLDRIEDAKKERESRAAAEQREFIPDREADPAAFIQWQQEQTLKEVRSLKEERAKERQLTEEEQKQQQFISEYQRQIDEFAQKTADYNDAAQFLAQRRDRELAMLGIDDPKERTQMLHQDALQIGAFALAKGRNPGQIFYELAKERGFKGTNPAVTPQNPSQPPVQPKSLSTIGGKPPGNSESLQARADRIINTTRWDEIVDLDGKEIEKVLRQMA
jgi:hypothetical protein